MAQPMTSEIMYKKEGKLGMTTLSFRSKQYTFPSLIVKPDMCSSDDPNAEGMCVLLDVGLLCPFCTGTFSAKFVRSHSRLAISQTPNFDRASGEAQAIEGVVEQQSLEGSVHPDHEGSVHPDHRQCCFTHAGTQTHSHQDQSGPDSDLELRRSVENELEGSGIHVHITPNRPGVKPRVANVVPLGRQMGQQSGHERPHQYAPQMLYPRGSRAEPRPRAPVPREGSSIYVQEKSSHFIVKHDVSKKHPQQTPKRIPPTVAPRTRSVAEQKGTSPPMPQKRPTRPQDRRSRGPHPADNKVRRVSRRKRCSSVERQEIVYEGENIVSGGYLETNLDDFTQSIKAEREGRHRHMPTSTVSNGEASGHSSDYGSMDSPRTKGDHQNVPVSEELTAVDVPTQHSGTPVVTQPEESPQSVKGTTPESLERPSTARYGKGMDWASGYDIRHPNHPMNRVRIGQPSSRRTNQSSMVSAVHASHSMNRPSEDTERVLTDRTRAVSENQGDTHYSKDWDADALQEERKKGNDMQVPTETTVKEILDAAAKYIKADVPDTQMMPIPFENVRTRTEETVSEYSGEQTEMKPETGDSVQPVLQGSVESNISVQKVGEPEPVLEQANQKSSETVEVQCVVQQVSEEEMDITSDSVFRVVEAAYAQASSTDESDTGSEVESEVFHPEETVDEILESVETETYSPNSTLSRAFTGPRRKRKKKAKRHGRPPAKASKDVTDFEVSRINESQETQLKHTEPPQDAKKDKVPQQIESKELYAAISRIVEKNSKPESNGKSELHQIVSRVIESEMRTPSPETILEEILEGVGTEEEPVPDSPNYDNKHLRTTMANMDSQTNTTFSSVELQQSIMLQENETSQKKVITSRSSSRNSLQTTLTSLQALQTEATVSRSSSCECLPEDAADTGSIERSVSTYDGTSDNSADDDIRDSESSEFHASNVGAGSETSIERIIDRTLYLTDKIIAAYPELGRSDENYVDHEAILATVATQSSFSDSDDVVDGQDDSSKHVHANILHISTDSGSSSLGREEPYQDEGEPQIPGSLALEEPEEDIINDEINDSDAYVTDDKEESTVSFKEVFDSELSLETDPDVSETDFHFSEAYSPPSAIIKLPNEALTDASAAVSTEEWSDPRQRVEVGSREEDPQVRSMILDRVTQDLYNIQHSLTMDGEKWLMEDFYQDAEMTELESTSSQGTLEKNRLSTEIQFNPETLEETIPEQHHDEILKENSNIRMVPRKVQFWVPDTNEDVVDQDPETIEAFETVERSLKEVEKVVNEMAGLSPCTDDKIQEVPSQTDLREVTDDQYNSEHTIEDVDQLESSCNEDFGSEFEDVIEAVVDEQLREDESVELTGPVYIEQLPRDQDCIEYTTLKGEDETETPRVPQHYISPIQSSSSESSEEEAEVRIGRTCEDVIREVRVENAQAETFVQDIVRQDSVQRSEFCITYVNIDGSSSSETVSDAFTEESDGSVINMQVKTRTPERRLEMRVEPPCDLDYETHLGFENNTFLEDEPDIVETLPKQRSLSDDGDDEDEDDIEAMRKIETLSLSLSSSSASDSETSDTDDSDHKVNLSQEYSAPEVIGVVQTISSQRHDVPEKEYCDVATDADDGKSPVDEEQHWNQYTTDAPTCSMKGHETEKGEKLVHIATFTDDLNHSTDTSACSDIHHVEPLDQSHHSQPTRQSSDNPPGSWEEVLAESTTNVASFETEDVLSKEQAQEFLRQMFGTNQTEGHGQENKKLDVCSAVVPAGGDGEVTSEEVSTQEVTLIFAWPKKPDEVIRKYEDPYREIHLHRVTKVSDFDIEVVEGPTVTTIERPAVPAITLEKQPDAALSKKLPAGKDAIVVHQKRKDTVTKRKRQLKSEQETVAMMAENSTQKDNSLAAYIKEEDGEGIRCDHSKSSDMEVDLDELLADTSDVSETFSVGGEPGKPSKKDASAQTDSLLHDSYALYDSQLKPSLLAMDRDSMDEGSCMSDSSQDDWSNDYEYLPDPED